jgi:hypothetical protein
MTRSVQSPSEVGLSSTVPSSSERAVTIPDWVRSVWIMTKGRSWEPPLHDSQGVLWLIENGFARRVDGRCGFEAFKDSMLQWTIAGRAALAKARPGDEGTSAAQNRQMGSEQSK